MDGQLVPFVICYDFDGTLAPGNMQENSFIPALRMSSAEFWEQSNQLAAQNGADRVLTYMYLTISMARQHQLRIRRESIVEYGRSIKCFPGVDEDPVQGVKSWFDRTRDYGRERGIEVRHYIISSGLKEMLEGCPAARRVDQIFASRFIYDADDIPVWPAIALNYTTKTQYLFRINKGCLSEGDDLVINKYLPDSERPVPFRHMVYIGDGSTDVPSMRVVKNSGGRAIAVYNPADPAGSDLARSLVQDGRADIGAAADYTEGSALDSAIKAMLDICAAESSIRANSAIINGAR
ncbi:MAG: haloacid dehalogenase-like hydrolase [Succinivibrionaceae bacterium]|nr:haloacid dehalogenase-like hydrolase [Succinivibrionaceae bacterium]